MKVTKFTRNVLAARKQKRDMLAKGYEEVGEGGGLLWELERGSRIGHKIIDAVVAVHGRSVYVKVEAPQQMRAA